MRIIIIVGETVGKDRFFCVYNIAVIYCHSDNTVIKRVVRVAGIALLGLPRAGIMKKMIKKIMNIILVTALVMNAVIPVCASEIPEDTPVSEENESIITEEDNVLEELNESKESLEDKIPGKDYNENEAVVITETRSEALKAARQYNGTLESYEYGVGVINLEKPYTETVEEILDAADLASEEEVEEITPDVAIQPQIFFHTTDIPSEVTGADTSRYWQHTKINDLALWNRGYFGNNAKVCVIDSGISTSSEVYPQVAAAIDYTGSSIEDTFGHGTHVAGIVAAPVDNRGIVGVAPRACLYIAKAGTNENDFALGNVYCAIEWAIQQDVDIINMSIGGATDDNGVIEELNGYMRRCRDHGILPVAAACNERTDTRYYPAACDCVISVGATDINDSLADFSNYGDWVDIAAPGKEIYSTTTGTSYGLKSGTSQASPVVAGAMALLHQTVSDTDNVSEYRQMMDCFNAVKTTTEYTYNGRKVTGGLDLNRFIRNNNGTETEPVYGKDDKDTKDDNDYYDEKTGTLVKIEEDEKYTKLSGGDTSALLIIKKEIPYTRNKKAIASAVCAKLNVLEGYGLSIRSVKAKKPKKNANYTTVTIKLRGSDKVSKKTAKAMNKQLKNIYVSLKSSAAEQ